MRNVHQVMSEIQLLRNHVSHNKRPDAIHMERNQRIQVDNVSVVPELRDVIVTNADQEASTCITTDVSNVSVMVLQRVVQAAVITATKLRVPFRGDVPSLV